MASKKSESRKLRNVEPLSRPPDAKPKPKEKFRTRRTTGAKPQVKTKRTTLKPARNKKQKEYTEKELGIPQLNGIIPAGVRKPPGKKRGKIFVDDAESMLAILGMVQAEKEGEREGKLMKARQLEEIREAKLKQAEKRQEAKKERLDEVKNDIRQKKRQRNVKDHDGDKTEPKAPEKRVSFG